MRAILLAAGIGSRLRPLTNNIPKCLMPIKGQPLLGIWLDHLSQANIGPFLINTHYLADQVESFIEASNYKNQVTLVNEPDLEGTAGTLIKNINFFQAEDGLLIHADNYCLADFIAFQKAHHNRPPECLMTMMTFRTDDPSSCGIVDLNERGIVTGFYEKLTKPPGNLANGAIYIISKELFPLLIKKSHEFTDFSKDVIPTLLGKIYTYETNSVMIDIGSSVAYEKANLIST